MTSRVSTLVMKAVRRYFPDGVGLMRAAAPSDATLANKEGYYREEQSRKVRELEKRLQDMQSAKVQYHTRQMNRHLNKMRRHKDQMAKDKDSNHLVYIESHKESAELHKQLLSKIRFIGLDR